MLNGNASLDEQSAGTEEVLDVFETAEFDGFDLTVTGLAGVPRARSTTT